MLENLAPLSTLAVLGVGLVFGIKHATEVDHVVAVSTIVSQHKNVFRSALVGVLWGTGHTSSLLIVGSVVLVLRVAIPEVVSNWLEFGVALMIIGLGVAALRRALCGTVHVHRHHHNNLSHVHIHFHENETKHELSVRSPHSHVQTPHSHVGTPHSHVGTPDSHIRTPHSHAVSQVGWKPVLIGTMHGLAGSGALTLLVLTEIKSAWIGFLYLTIFGVGSMLGMVLMSGLIGFPFALTSRNLTSLHHRLQTAAAVLSICFGFWYAYASGALARIF